MKASMRFFDSLDSRLLLTGFESKKVITSCIIVIMPFAEEMNKSRHMVTRFAAELIEKVHHGVAVHIVDLYGTGDSEGDLETATINMWQYNISHLVSFAKEQYPHSSISLLGIRTGALITLDAYLKNFISKDVKLLFWQPVFNGSQFINQFLRLKLMSSMLTGTKLSMTDLFQELKVHDTLDVCGYVLSHQLINDFEHLNFFNLEQLPPNLNLSWFEIGNAPQATFSPMSQRLINRWQQSENALSVEFIQGETFWKTQEIVINQPLIDATIVNLGMNDE
ncbi:hydrolase 2, exosortase A system-associated [Psychrobium sp. 1_MG-2023]|uniref:hydrolase 2, exosortase A system-associated n=1 Tax=Psychrobium sp. 1_MG-2023 TaxID=3062624 RepID=UPI000C33C2B7|nr:hydrolase 2, exosortase A system-associated [Psychrobium sp. 1_MG-2023]MDP2561298.1 hydrolase 2, exosortase A system-associated [Psychrobium sp. 1_MG-2023]PKF54114.1 hydrolase 2, exosortase A system-associated [Alteromonadales bacterium alter-6D02]